MELLIHIVIALTSLAWTTYLLFSPSHTKLRVSYALVALTLASGTYMVVSTHAPMLRACMSGLFYVGLATVGILTARNRLVAQEAEAKTHQQF